MRARTAAACAAVASLALPAAAGAATKTVDMGLPLSAQRQFNQKFNVDVNDFFPHGVTIHVGDSVKFLATGFHTVDLPPKGQKAVPLVVPAGGLVSGVNDAAGNAFWFNGQPLLGPNPQALGPGGLGKKFTYNGKQRVLSGAFEGNGAPPPMTVKFTKVGSYTYFCDIHAGMKGVVHVVAKKARVPSAKADARTVKKQLARDLKLGKKLAKTTAPKDTVIVGPAGAHGVEFFAFAPAKQTVPVGTTVKFTLPSASFDIHTATTGPGNPGGETGRGSGYLGDLENEFNGQAPPSRVLYPSDPFGAAASLTASSHGNGFWNSGLLDNRVAPLKKSESVTFNQAGTYTFYCLVHPFMKATVTVTG